MMICWTMGLLGVMGIAATAAPRVVTLSAETPATAAVGDLNGDGRPDLVVATPRAVSAFLNQGAGRFAPQPKVTLSRDPTELTIADLNGDGKLDVATADHNTFGIDILLGDGKGGLTKHRTLRARMQGPPHIHGIHAADLNRDDKMDLVMISVDTHELLVLDGDGHGGFTPAKVTALRRPFNSKTTDFNGDGIRDFAVPQFGSDTLSILLGDGKGGLAHAPGSPHKLLPRPYNVAIGDVNGDGHHDIAVSQDDIRGVNVLLGDGKGSFRKAAGSPFEFDQVVYNIAFADANNDGRLDLIGGGSGGLSVLAQGRDGSFSTAPKLFTEPESWNFLATELDGDGKRDFVIWHARAGKLSVLLSAAH